MNTPDDDTARDDDQVRERSAEEREIVAPTPADVRAKDKGSKGDEEPEPPAADVQAP
ncbi:hypothetical protein OG455_03175 [Kitasatospora sp. NBC_01287]|uniref:hypothetical protein n=1 Tax=Kitasatospora sp. NBC_01287 TaxID=2903573 RepID=UPI00224DF361|nr:hypothetical protein [Kitasatospora sp. NBC_01287]MCX4744530.1 hypothetical protein [Kitasatospora sp. NBC_01287]